MFLLAIIEDKIKITPDKFGRDTEDVLKEQIEIKFSNRVLLNVGLCITFYDFLDVGEPYLYPSEGSAIQQVRFRMIVFRPFMGEILTGRLHSSNSEGLKISLDFFDDIVIPSSLFPSPCFFDENSGIWTWKYTPEEGEDALDFVMEIGEEIRFKVRTINFTGLTNSVKGVMATTTSETHDIQIHGSANDVFSTAQSADAAKQSSGEGKSSSTDQLGGTSAAEESKNGGDKANDASGGLAPPPMLRRRSSSIGLSPDDELPSAMQVIGCINDFGLGLVTWW